MSRRIAILGGGAAGVSIASKLARNCSFDVHLFEKLDHLGGLIGSETLQGRSYDIGAFFFRRDCPLLSSFPSLRECLVPIKLVEAVLMTSSNLYSYPPGLGTILAEEGCKGAASCPLSLLRGRLRFRRRNRDNLRNYASYQMGDYFYRLSGLQGYVRCLYQMPDEEVDIKFARQRLPHPGLRTLVRISMLRILRLGRPAERNRVWLGAPARGFGAVFSQVSDVLANLGAKVFLSADIRGIRRDGEQFVLETPQGSERFHRVVSTIPVPAALELAGLKPEAEAETISLYSVFFLAPFSGGWTVLYNYTGSGGWKRLLNNATNGSLQGGKAHFTLEITTRDTDVTGLEAAWAEARHHLLHHGVFPGGLEPVGSRLTPDAYPVFRAGREEEVQRQVARLEEMGFDTVGRQGRHDYLTASEACSAAQTLGERIIAQSG